ncbi:hypothetical protein HAHE_10080 [Haloferula helveola]|uniref:Squalene cyclase C-terminal domain-containing protein n=1 Tax=Haloferula helveola TaxID=490095 RepID=A0ABN6H0S6_9BACT|nr:hypothetical protein HAHE_10080 [Haloferula helveola]
MKRADFLRLLLLAPLGGQRLAASESSMAGAVEWLLSRQSPDGAWRSDAYGAFRDGRALTPVVLRCLSLIPDPSLDDSRDKAVKWLLGKGASLFEHFPIHAASSVLECAAQLESLAPLRGPALSRLVELRLPGGGWSYSPVPPKPGVDLAPMQQPNLSATAIALDGLHAARAPIMEETLGFIQGCQNFGTPDAEFDDGGFFQMPLDPARNKAGSAGIGKDGRKRFLSYAAATADGLRALRLSGEPPDSARCAAGRAWLKRFRWTPDAAPSDLAYYTARSLTLTAAIDSETPRYDLPASLSQSRRPDGSWLNPAGEMRENCPLVASSLALEATLRSTI